VNQYSEVDAKWLGSSAYFTLSGDEKHLPHSWRSVTRKDIT